MRVIIFILSLLFSCVLSAQDRISKSGFEAECKEMDSPLTLSHLSLYSSPPGGAWGGAGVPFGSPHGWVFYTVPNLRVRSFKFVAVAGLNNRVQIPSSAGGVAASISSMCGEFDVGSACQGLASAPIWYTSTGAPFRCQLTPGAVYYLNFAFFNLPQYNLTREIINSCSSPSGCPWGWLTPNS